MIKLNAIAAMCDHNNGIGKNNSLPWHLKKEFDYFLRFINVQNCSTNKVNALIVGRLTWESTPLNLKEINSNLIFIVSSQYYSNKDLIDYKSYDPTKIFVVKNFNDALNLINEQFFHVVESIIAIGGSLIYLEAMNSKYFNRFYLTRIFKHYDCDTFIEPKNFLQKLKRLSNLDVEYESKLYECEYNSIQNENDTSYVFEVYEKK